MRTRKLFSTIFTLYLVFSACHVSLSQVIATGLAHSLTLCSDASVYSCGSNFYGTLGDGTNTNRSTPVQVATLGNTVTAVAAGGLHSIFLKTDGTVWACGRNAFGQLGNGTTTNTNTPLQVATLGNTVTAIAGGYEHSLFLKSDGTVWACGLNSAGQLGDGTTTQRTTPIQITSLGNTVTAIAAAGNHSLFLKSDGTVWSCGYNLYGQLGDGTTTNRTTPVQMVSLNNIIAIAAGRYHSVLLRNDGTVWTCGNNNAGQLGDGTTTGRTTPVQATSLGSTVSDIDGGGNHSLFLKNDGTVWASGYNAYGQLGDGTTTDRSIPVQAASLGNTVIDIAAGTGDQSLFLKGDGTVWSCGRNQVGQLGDGSTTDRSTPVQMNTCVVTPLPIELLYFNAQQDGGAMRVLCNWATSAEINNDFFTLERSLDAIHFEELKIRQGAGNSTDVINYIDYDESPYSGISYYRLKQTDFDGQFSYSNIRAVFLNELDIINLYPSPAMGQITLIIGSSSDDIVSLQVIDVLGRTLINKQYNILKGLTTIQVNTSSLVSGSYIVKATNSKASFTEKEFIKK